MYDPGWDMPKVNWVPQGSFEPGEIPPAYAPDAGPLVCLPPINQYWLPLVLGCLDQLRNPSTWIVANDDSMFAALSAANRLMQMFGERAVCPVAYELRMEGCALQSSVDAGVTWTEVTGWSSFIADCIPPQTLLEYDSGCTLSESLDGGTTYTAVPGWIDNFGNCVQEYTPIIGLPPNPGDKTGDQLACAIAAYLAEQVVIAAMGKAVTAVSTDLTLLQFGLDVVNIVPEFVLVSLAADAFSAYYVAVSEGTLSDFEAALTDAPLLAAVTCALYTCIRADGYVKPDNFACILTGIAAISYAHADVITAIGAYLTAVGAVGLAQLSQVAGLHAGEDCSACGTWCYRWDFRVSDGGWVNYVNAPAPGVYVPTVGWQSQVNVAIGYQATVIAVDMGASIDILDMYLLIATDNTTSPGERSVSGQLIYGVSDVFTTGLGDGATPFPGSVAHITPDVASRYLVYNFGSDSGPQTPDTLIYVEIHGTGTLPVSLSGGAAC